MYSRKKSPAPKKMPMKSPIKPASRFNDNFSLRRISPMPKKTVPLRGVKKCVNENFVRKENVIKPAETKKETPPKTSSRKLEYSSKPVEGIDFNFEIPTILMKKRDSKANDKTENDSCKGSHKEFADITNQNIDGLSSTTPIRCITGKSSVVRSDLSFLNSNLGSGKSTPNITPYKMMRRNKENGKDGNNITSLELKIKELEEQILKSKTMKDDDEEENENNDFLDGMSQVDVSKLAKEKPIPVAPKKIEPVIIEEPVVEKEKTPEKPIEESKPEPEEILEVPESEEEAEDIAELENMLGKVFTTLKKDQKLPTILQDKIKAYENLTTDLMRSVKNPQVVIKSPEEPQSCRSRKSAQKRKNRPGRRRRSNRHKKKYDSIDLYHETS